MADYTLTQSDFSEICGKKADKIIVEVNFLEDMEKYKSVLVDDLYICNLRRLAVADAFPSGRPALMNGC